MRWGEIIVEVSAGERRRQLKAAAEKARRDELERRSALSSAELVKQQRRKTRLDKKLNPTVASGSNAEEPAGIFADPKFDKYRVDTSIDTDFEGGYYLYFNITMRGVDLYWGRSVERFEQAKQFNQYKFMGREFDADKFQDVLNYIVRKTGRNGQPGYCSVVIPRRYLTHPYVQGAYSYLMTHYPQDDPTMDATVYWELV
jgi:hypothetical protein